MVRSPAAGADVTKAVTAAEAIVADLMTKREAATKHVAELTQQRAGIALAAHTAGGEARKKLDNINRQSAMHESELASLSDAIGEADARLASARHAAGMAAERERAEGAVEKIDALAELAAELDATTLKLRDLITSAFDTVSGLNRDQIPNVPPDRLFQLGVGRAFRSVLAARLKLIVDIELVAPSSRTTVTDITSSTVTAVHAWRDRVCGRQDAA